jgi:hypothetical protein
MGKNFAVLQQRDGTAAQSGINGKYLHRILQAWSKPNRAARGRTLEATP